MALNLPLDPAAMSAFVTSKPTVPMVKKFATDFLTAHGKSQDVIDDLLVKIDSLAVPLPLAPDVTLISDANAYRAACMPSPFAEPVAEVRLFHALN
jgi:hypothetical protein